MYNSFRPGKFWYDTEGKRIHAHAGAILYVDGKYWWYGENKENITGWATGELCPYRHHGMKLYSSEDLYNWKDEGFLFPESDDPAHPFHPANIIDRPHVLFNKKTGLYVMWVKAGRKRDFTHCTFAICVGKDLKSMQYVTEFIPEPHCAGDFDLFETDGKAYVVFENPHSEMVCRELNDEYTGLGERYSTHLHLGTPPDIREAPCFFERNGRKYLLTSGTTSYWANPTIAYDITDIHGEWKDLGLTCVNDKNQDSFCAQFSSVFKHPFIDDLYIALGDRWLTDCPLDMPNMCDIFRAKFAGGKSSGAPAYNMKHFSESDTSQAGYVWLPVQFDEQGTPFIEWKTDWTIE